jgi:hypothetical protein
MGNVVSANTNPLSCRSFSTGVHLAELRDHWPASRNQRAYRPARSLQFWPLWNSLGIGSFPNPCTLRVSDLPRSACSRATPKSRGSD